MESLNNKVIANGYAKTTTAGRGLVLNIDLAFFGTIYLNAFPHEKAGSVSDDGKPYPYFNLVVYIEDERGERKSIQVGALWHKVKQGYEYKTGTLDLSMLSKKYDADKKVNIVVGATQITPTLKYDFSQWTALPVILKEVRGFKQEYYKKNANGEGGIWEDMTPQYQLQVMGDKEEVK